MCLTRIQMHIHSAKAGLVRVAGIEPARLSAQDFKSRASTSFAILANFYYDSKDGV